jgi:hypothetical protein
MSDPARCPSCGQTDLPARPYGGRFVREDLELSLPAFCEECGWRGSPPKPVNPDPPSLQFAILALRWTVRLLFVVAMVGVGFVLGYAVRGGTL